MNDFLVPKYELVAVLFTALGAAISFQKVASAKTRTWALSHVVDLIFSDTDLPRVKKWVEFLLFVILGVCVGIALTQPTNAMQAITAGLGWTALLTKNVK